MADKSLKTIKIDVRPFYLGFDTIKKVLLDFMSNELFNQVHCSVHIV